MKLDNLKQKPSLGTKRRKALNAEAVSYKCKDRPTYTPHNTKEVTGNKGFTQKHKAPRKSPVVLTAHWFPGGESFSFMLSRSKLTFYSETVSIFNACPGTYNLAQEGGEVMIF